jgi:hypothetical protein
VLYLVAVTAGCVVPSGRVASAYVLPSGHEAHHATPPVVPRLRISGAVPPLRHVLSWRVEEQLYSMDHSP